MRRSTADASPEDPDEFYDHQLVGPRGVRRRRRRPRRGDRAGARRRPGPADRPHPDGRDALVPFVKALVPEVDLAGRTGRGRRPPRPGRAAARGRPSSSADRPRHDLPRLPRPARALPGRQGAGQGPASTCASTTCADWTHDRHRTVDDTPYGGGAGMVMKPEPWGEAFDELLAVDGRHGRRADPVGPAVHPGGRARPGHPGPARLRLRPLRGHRPAGARRGRAPAAEVRRGLARRLRPQRGRGGRARDHRGGGAPAARLHGQRRVAGRGVATRTACWSTPSTPSRPPGAAARCPPVLLSGDHAAIAAWRHEQAVRRTARAPARPAARLGAARRRRDAAGVRPADAGELSRAAAGLLGAGAARQPRRAHPRAARDARRLRGLGGARHRPGGPFGRTPGRRRRGRPWPARRGRSAG